jgi:peptidoglycan/LPS O-acetylase OafA/YrhL
VAARLAPSGHGRLGINRWLDDASYLLYLLHLPALNWFFVLTGIAVV